MMNHVLTAVGVAGVLLMGAQAIADPRSQPPTARRQLLDCMSRRMSADKAALATGGIGPPTPVTSALAQGMPAPARLRTAGLALLALILAALAGCGGGTQLINSQTPEVGVQSQTPQAGHAVNDPVIESRLRH